MRFDALLHRNRIDPFAIVEHDGVISSAAVLP
jgi:hypothetical protein